MREQGEALLCVRAFSGCGTDVLVVAQALKAYTTCEKALTSTMKPNSWIDSWQLAETTSYTTINQMLLIGAWLIRLLVRPATTHSLT